METLLHDLMQAVCCAECGERMTFDADHKEWLCPNLHQSEPENEVYLEVLTATEAINRDRLLYGLPPLNASRAIEALQKGDALADETASLFCQAVQVDVLRGGMPAADEAFRKYCRTKSVEDYKADYEAFLDSTLRSPLAGWWPWLALGRAGQLGQEMRARRDITDAWEKRWFAGVGSGKE